MIFDSINGAINVASSKLYKQGAYLESWDENLDLNLYNEISLETCISKRISAGSTGYKSVEKQIEFVTEFINGKESIY